MAEDRTQTETGGENVDPAEREPTHEGGPHDEHADEPLGPMTPDADDGRPLGDTPEAHDGLSPHDLPIDHPGRLKAEELAPGPAETTTGNV